MPLEPTIFDYAALIGAEVLLAFLVVLWLAQAIAEARKHKAKLEAQQKRNVRAGLYLARR